MNRPQTPVQKQGTNVYTVMLIISFLCVLTACLLLWFELNRWGEDTWRWWDTREATPNTQSFNSAPLETGVPSHVTWRA